MVLRFHNSLSFQIIFFVIGLICIKLPVYADSGEPETEGVPVIPELSSRNPVFARYMQEIEYAYQCIAAGREIPLVFYQYTVKENETLLQIAARCSIPYEQIALLNTIPVIDTVLTGTTIYLPNAPGLFVPEYPETAIGTLVKKRLYTSDAVLWYSIGGNVFQYVPEERLTPTERAFFLDTTLKIPLEDSVLTSQFGMRTSPITGNQSFHKGIDLAAPEGTLVFACKSGIVANTGYDDVYGNFIILDHENNTQSVYAHLSRISVTTGDTVNSGSTIGNVGTTGASTGPHLHFEIRVNGSAQDPRRLLPAF